MAVNNYFGSVNGNQTSNVDNPSRLTESTAGLRNTLLSRNLYTEFTQYPLQNNDRQKIVNTVGSIINTIQPFNTNSITDGVLSRLVTTPNTPLTEIGLLMLGKQFAYNFKSNLAQETFPQINIKNVFDGDPNTKLFQKNRNFRITKREDSGTLENFVEKFIGFTPRRDDPFDYDSTNKDYLNQTGPAQLDFLFGSSNSGHVGGLNKNLYKPQSKTVTEYSDIADINGNELNPQILILSNKPFFNFTNSKFNPFISIYPIPDAEIQANTDMTRSLRNLSELNESQIYGEDSTYIRNLGNTLKGDRDHKEYLEDSNDFVDSEDGLNESLKNQIVWGRDGITSLTNERLSKLRGDVKVSIDGNNLSGDAVQSEVFTDFNVRGGLLEYTRNLLNASGGQIVDQTKKVFKKGNRLVGFNGSGLWKAPEGSLFSGQKGVRQHTVLDQYDRFAKAIRFDGNQVYNGNENSVVYNSVLPRIHPTVNGDGTSNNKNLMFSIENLAVRAFKGEGDYGIIDDEYGTRIPNTEIGSFGGRLMWFPPYDISINEAISAKYDTNVMIGRSEPIYSYMHSERSANLSFKLIVDYPDQLKNIQGANHKTIAEFFAFGSSEFTDSDLPTDPSKKIETNEITIKEIEGPSDKVFPEESLPQPFNISFPNDIPKSDGTASVIDELYNYYKYEVVEGLIGSRDGVSYGINARIYDNSGVTTNSDGEKILNVPVGFLQSTAPFEEGRRKLDDAIYNIYKESENYKYYEIVITATSTKLYTSNIKNDDEAASEYNQKLSERRANAAKDFIKKRIEVVIGKNADTQKINIRVNPEGSDNSDDRYDDKNTINERGAKLERTAIISFERTSYAPENKETNISPNDEESVRTLKDENQGLQSSKNISNRSISNDAVMEERNRRDEADADGGILKGFQSITKNYFYPAFHSQTPEDFHRRLTFLHQCTRQGSAIRSKPIRDENGVERVKNSVFGRQPICILRIADFFYTKVIIENITIDYDDAPWDTNPEGFGMQPMIADVTIQMKVLGGQSLKGPIDALQNAVSFNYYANSTFSDKGVYKTARYNEEQQSSYIEGVLTTKEQQARAEFNAKIDNNFDGHNLYGYTEDDKLK